MQHVSRNCDTFLLLRYDRPGNVRGLENAIERAGLPETTDVLQLNGLPPQLSPIVAPRTNPAAILPLAEVEQQPYRLPGFWGHETRITAFNGSPAPQTFLARTNQAAANGFHETRNTRHESRRVSQDATHVANCDTSPLLRHDRPGNVRKLENASNSPFCWRPPTCCN